ncbi:Aminoglycoside phosphotransferase [Penicillium odoratum]|uniref:Aminoglycoside phosphotransferase n=1 Tax=Penicillium odoratum TaxID=1167516 RepID=UPI0025494051|nr:Aminoglycoside phosphotransferase [Penicillium odoratum]KAJ5746192.1 Aminoglycoside phosphotransferase [Penicillium odoratum]
MDTIESQHYALVNTILQDHFGIQKDSFKISEIEKAKHNHVYLIQLDQPLPELPRAKNQSSKPFISAILAGTSKLILRIPKDNVSLEESVRIHNEVAFLALARDALYSIDPLIIPRVFGWEDAPSPSPFGLRWILQEYKEGESLSPDDLFALDDDTQRTLLHQIAQVVKAFQEYQLPESIMYGGLKFDDQGDISSTVTVLPCGGPFPSYAHFLRGMCTWQLSASERSTHLNGWRDKPKLRKRLDAFFAEGLDRILAEIPEDRPTLVHADIGLPNLLFDCANGRLTAVLDFGFAHIGAPISEYLFSFYDIDGLMPGIAQPLGPLRKYMLDGFPAQKKRIETKLKLALAWDNALIDVGAKKPSNIPKAGDIADLWWFSQDLCQAFWFMDRFLKNRTPAALDKLKDGSARNLERYLKQWGF